MYSGNSLKHLHSQVRQVIELAGTFGGIPFGGYVKDVVVKVVSYDYSETQVNDLDLWFTSVAGRASFVSDLTNKLVTTRNRKPSLFGALDVESYLLKDNQGDALIYVDLVVSSTFPGNDFNVNMLSWDCKTEKFDTNSEESVSSVIECIRKKRAVITEDFFERLNKDKCCRVRMYNKFLSKGWRVFHLGYEVHLVYKSSTVKNSDEAENSSVVVVECLDSLWEAAGYTRDQLRTLRDNKAFVKDSIDICRLQSLKEEMVADSENVYSDDIELIASVLDNPLSISNICSLVFNVDEGVITPQKAFGYLEKGIKERLETVNMEKRALDAALARLHHVEKHTTVAKTIFDLSVELLAVNKTDDLCARQEQMRTLISAAELDVRTKEMFKQMLSL